MTPTSALGGIVYGLSAGLLMVLLVLVAIHNPFRRTPARVVIRCDPPASGATNTDPRTGIR